MAPLEDIIQPAPLGPPRLGLYATVPVHDVTIDPATGAVTGGDARDVNGDAWRGAAVTFLPEPCGGEGGTFDPSCGSQAVNIAGDSRSVGVIEHFTAFGIYEPERCSALGYGGVDVLARADRAMLYDEPKQAERELWKGTQAQAMGATANRWLARTVAGPNTDANGNLASWPPAVTQLNAGAATEVVRALGDLEMAIASGRSGGRCLIHASRRTVSYWIYKQLLYRAGNLLLTVASDTLVVSGEGYDGSSPAGAVDATHNTAWAYATGPIEVYRSQAQTTEASHPDLRLNNTRVAIASRQVAFVIDPCVYVGVNITHT